MFYSESLSPLENSFNKLKWSYFKLLWCVDIDSNLSDDDLILCEVLVFRFVKFASFVERNLVFVDPQLRSDIVILRRRLALELSDHKYLQAVSEILVIVDNIL